MIGVRGEGERRRRQGSEGVAKDGEWLSALQAIGVVACGKLCEAGEPVGDAFDGAEPDGARADGGQECGEYGRGGLAASGAGEAGRVGTVASAVEASMVFCFV